MCRDNARAGPPGDACCPPPSGEGWGLLRLLKDTGVIGTGLGEVNVWGVSGLGTGTEVERRAESE